MKRRCAVPTREDSIPRFVNAFCNSSFVTTYTKCTTLMKARREWAELVSSCVR